MCITGIPKKGTFSEKELSQAENIIQRSIQYYHFKQEIKILSMLEGNDSQFQDCGSAQERNSIVKLNCNLHKLDLLSSTDPDFGGITPLL